MRLFQRTAVAALSLTAAQVVVAQAAGTAPTAPNDDGAITEIIVTAQKRSESILTTPVSVTAISTEELRKLSPRSATDLVARMPALQVNVPTGNQAPVFSLRGLSQNDYSAVQSGPVAVYTDEVYRSGFVFFSDQLYDLERVEVLRGPQGTLYGRNATGGAINLIAAKPGFDRDGSITLAAGNYGAAHVDGAWQTKLADHLAGRIAFTFSRADGWQKNLGSGNDSGEQRDYGVRFSLKYGGDGPVEGLLQLATSSTGPMSTPNVPQAFSAGVGGGIYGLFNAAYPASNPKLDYFPTYDWKHTNSDARLRADTASHDAALHVTWHLGPSADLLSITAFNSGHYWFREPNATGTPLMVLGDTLLYDGDQFSQELRLSTRQQKRVNAIFGGIVSRDRLHANTNFTYYTDVDFNGDGAINSGDCLANLDPAQLLYPLGCVQNNRFRQIRKSVAAYADLVASISAAVKLHAGARYTRDRLSIEDYSAWASGSDGVPLFNTIPGDPVNVTAGLPSIARTYSKPTGRLGLDYTLHNGTLLYLNFSRGYRTGAVNAAAYNSIDELTFAVPEVLDSVEAGVKGMYWDRRLQVTASAFHYSYKNQQALNVDPATFLQTVVNVAKSRLQGAELEVVVRPVPQLTLRGAISVLDSKIEEGSLGGASLAGNQLALAPKTSGSLGVDWDAYRGSTGKLSLSASTRFNGSQFSDLFNDPNAEFKSYSVIDGRIQYAFEARPLTVALVGKNLADKFYYTNRFNLAAFGYIYNHVGAPRTFGIEATYLLR